MSDQKEYKNLKTLSKELDTLAIVILDTLQSIISEKQYLDNNLKEGYINMAKSRYLMRGQKISTLQINTTKLIPSYKVMSESDTAEGVDYISYHSIDSTDLKGSGDSVKRRPVKLEDLSEKLEKAAIDSEDKKNDSEDKKSDYEDKKNDSEDKKSDSGFSSECASPTDPLRWFGVLVPESLRTCQTRFKQATDTALKIASLQNQLKALGSKYKELKLQKDTLVNDN